MPYSYSQINNWRTCPARLRFYRQKVQVPEPEIMQMGALAHSVYEAYFRHCMAENVPTDLMMLPTIAQQQYRDTADQYRRRRKPYLSDEQFQSVLNELVLPFGETHMVNLNDIAEIEQQIAIRADMQPCEWLAPDVWFRGIVDLLEVPDDETLRIVDYKTGFAVESDALQMAIYAWLLFGLYPHVQWVECVFDYTRFNIRKPQQFGRSQAPEIDAEVRQICSNIEADTEMAPAPGLHCLTCQYAHVCEAKTEVPGAIESVQDAQKAVEAISLLERDLKGTKEALRLWCTANGNVEHNGTCWGFHAQGDRGFDDAAAFHDEARKLGLDPFKYLSVNNTKAKRLLDDLAHIAVPTRKTVFAGRKVSGGEE